MITIFGAFEWLNYFDDKKTYLSPSSQYLWEKIWRNLKRGAMAKREEILTDLVYICDPSNQLNVSAEACLKCGIAYFSFEEINESINFLQEAIHGYQTHRHNLTVARWALGYVLLVKKDKRDDAIFHWKSCVKIYRDLQRAHRFEKDRVEWYQKIIPEMDYSLKEAATYQII